MTKFHPTVTVVRNDMENFVFWEERVTTKRKGGVWKLVKQHYSLDIHRQSSLVGPTVTRLELDLLAVNSLTTDYTWTILQREKEQTHKYKTRCTN